MRKIEKIEKGIYILNEEAKNLYKGIITEDWTGFIPYSLELIKLQEEKIKINKNNGLYVSRDIINVKFNNRYDEAEIIEKAVRDMHNKQNQIKNLKNKLDNLNAKKQKSLLKKIELEENNLKSLKCIISSIESGEELYKLNIKKIKAKKNNRDVKHIEKKIKKIGKQLNSLNLNNLREELYKNGFVLNGDKYVMYKRSGSKSRKGNVLFIKENLYSKMMDYSYMGLKFGENEECDIVGLAAYSSLVSSSIKDTIRLLPKNILIIEDMHSSWIQDCNIVFKGKDGLEVKSGSNKLNSCFTDGSSLLDQEFFREGQDFKLLRQHFFKSCAFKCDMQKYYKEHAMLNNINYEKWKIKDMFGQDILVKNIKLVITPNSLKALKFADRVGGKKEMYNYWKEQVKASDCIFGVVKWNKATKFNFNGVRYSQNSYQHLNSLNLDKRQLEDLCRWEIDYVTNLKNNMEFFKDHLLRNANEMNSNEMVYSLLEHNPAIINSKFVKEFKRDVISGYVQLLKRGKIKNKGDYNTIIANPLSYLKASIGNYKEEEIELKGNEIYTKLFNNNKELVCFRNPHTSYSNVFVAKNKYVEDIDKYFGFGEDIVCVNAVNFDICQRLSGADFDSDTMLIMDNPTLLNAAKVCYSKYKVVENGINQSKKKSKYNKIEMQEMDSVASRSQRNIGEAVNLGQLCMSVYYDKLNSKNGKEEELKELMELIDICNILNGMAIDSAKKSFEVNIEEEIKSIRSRLNKFRDKKPNFFKYISQDKRLKNAEERKERLKKFDCTMDNLIEVLENVNILPRASYSSATENKKFLNKKIKGYKSERIEGVIEKVEEYNNYIEGQFFLDKKLEENEIKLMEFKTKNLIDMLKKRSLKDGDIRHIVSLALEEGGKESKYKLRLLNCLHKVNKDAFISCFIEEKNFKKIV